MMSDNCINKVKEILEQDEKTKGFVSDKALKEFIEDIESAKVLSNGDPAIYKKLMAEKFAKMEASKRISAIKKQHNKMVVADMNRFIVENDGNFKSFESAFRAYSLGGTAQTSMGGNAGALDIGKSIRDSVLSPMEKRLRELGAFDDLALGKDGELQGKVLDELLNLQRGGVQKITDSQKAHEVARVFKVSLDQVHAAKNANGIPTVYREGYLGKQFWSQEKISEFKDHVEFRKYVEENYNIDEAKTFGKHNSDSNKEKFYKDMYEGILFGQQDPASADGVGDEFITVVSTKDHFNKMTKGRKIEFKYAKDYEKMITDMGNGNYLETLINQIDKDSRSIGYMTKFGTNPDKGHAAAFERFKRHYAEKYKNDPKKLADLKTMNYETRMGWIGGSARDMSNMLSGRSFSPGTSTKAKIANIATSIETFSKLGLSGFSAFGDIPRSLSLVTAQNGENWFSSAWKYSSDLFDSFGGSSKEVAKRAGFLFENDVYLSGYSPDEAWGAGSITQKANKAFHKITGLNALTKKTQEVMHLSVTRTLAENSKLSYNQLPDHFRQNYLERYNIKPEHWDALRAAKDQLGDREFIDLEKLDQVVSDKSLVQKAKQGYYLLTYDMMRLSSGEANSNHRFSMTAGKSIDDAEGAARKVFMQFKSFMFSQGNSILRAGSSSDRLSTNLGMSAHLMVTTMAGYYIADSIKKMISGKPARDMSDPKEVADLMIRSGAGGAYIDFLIGSSNFLKDDKSLTAYQKMTAGGQGVKRAVTSLLGPASGLIWDSGEAAFSAMSGNYHSAGKTMEFALKSRVPGQNLHIIKLLKDTEIINTMSEMF